MSETPAKPHSWSEKNWSKTQDYKVCTICGIVQRADKKNKPCRGQVGLRPFSDKKKYTENNPFLLLGTKVELPYTGEKGVVVACWDDAGIWDCYVAFFGKTLPTKKHKPKQKPYVLRYYASTLKVLKDGG